MIDQYLTINEVSELLRIHRITVERWLKDGVFPEAIDFQGTKRIPRSDLDRLKAKYTNRLKETEQLQDQEPEEDQEPQSQEAEFPEQIAQ